MAEMYFEDHPTDPDKVIIRKPQRQKPEWVGLTEEDFVLVHQLCKTPIEAAEYTEHLLKEKNT